MKYNAGTGILHEFSSLHSELEVSLFFKFIILHLLALAFRRRVVRSIIGVECCLTKSKWLNCRNSYDGFFTLNVVLTMRIIQEGKV